MPKIFNVNALMHSFSCSKKSLQQYFKDVIKKITFQQYFKDTTKKKKRKKKPSYFKINEIYKYG